MYASFYIVDTDRCSGAHVMMKRSHNRKPLRMLLGSAVASEDAVRHQFGSENEITIEGPAGLGFGTRHIVLSPRDTTVRSR